MTILTSIFYSLSDAFTFVTLAYYIFMIGDYNCKYKKHNLIISLLYIVMLNGILYSDLPNQNQILQYILIAFNFSKFFVSASFTFQKISFKIICISLIVQFASSTLASSIQSAITSIISSLPTNFVHATILLAINSFILCIILYLYKHKNNKYINIISVIPKHIFILIFLCFFLTNGLIETINYESSNIETKLLIIKAISLVLVVLVTTTLVSLILNVISKKYYSDINKMLENQVKVQIKHYELRERLNDEIRSFRHDYINHMGCIQSLLDSGKYNDASDYISNMTSKIPDLSFIYNTGNYIADAILTDKQETAGNDIEILFEGIVPLSINNTDLCIVLSNALDNAIEASRKCNSKCLINVYSSVAHGYFVLSVSNPTILALENTDKLPLTTKQDLIHHGFGLSNIKRIAEKYSGLMKIDCSDGVFYLKISMKINE